MLAVPSVFAMDYDLEDAIIDGNLPGLSVEKNDSGNFVEVDNLMPGDTINRSYILTNSSWNYYDVWLRAANPKSTPEELDLVNKLELKLTFDGNVIYDGKVGGGRDENGNTMENNIYLGRITQNSKHQLDASFHAPGEELDNRYQKAGAEVTWEFSAVRTDDPIPTPTPITPTPTTTPGTPVIIPPGGGVVPGTVPPTIPAPILNILPGPVVLFLQPLNPTIPDTPPAEVIEDTPTPLAQPEGIHCWWHWLMLILGIIYLIYAVLRIIFRKRKNASLDNELDDMKEGFEEEFGIEYDLFREKLEKAEDMEPLEVLQLLLALKAEAALEGGEEDESDE